MFKPAVVCNIVTNSSTYGRDPVEQLNMTARPVSSSSWTPQWLNQKKYMTNITAGYWYHTNTSKHQRFKQTFTCVMHNHRNSNRIKRWELKIRYANCREKRTIYESIIQWQCFTVYCQQCFNNAAYILFTFSFYKSEDDYLSVMMSINHHQ